MTRDPRIPELAATLMLVVASFLGRPEGAFGGEVSPGSSGAASAGVAARTASGSSKVIDFDDGLVEGLNKQPLDSVSQLADGRRRRAQHLYRVRRSFRSETESTVRGLAGCP